MYIAPKLFQNLSKNSILSDFDKNNNANHVSYKSALIRKYDLFHTCLIKTFKGKKTNTSS